MKKLIIVIATFSSVFMEIKAQISINALNQVYTQDFNALGTNDVTWANEVTIPGWYYVHSTNGVDAGPITNLVASAGEFISPKAFNLGTANSNDRALGSLGDAFPQLIEFYYGARFINNTTNIINNVTLNYAGEQWFDQGANPNTLQFFFRVGGSNFLGDTNNTGWIAIPTLNFDSPQNNFAITSLDGNNATNRVVIDGNIPIVISPGEEFWIRWAHLDLPGHQSLGVDDLALNFSNTNVTTNTPTAFPNSVSNVLGVSLELKKPNPAKILKFAQKGFKVKAWLSSTNTLTKASFATFSGSTNTLTNLIFTDFGLFKILTKGFLFKKKGVTAIAQTKGSGNKAGVGIAPASSSVTLVIKVDGTQGTNGSASAFFTNVFTEVKVK